MLEEQKQNLGGMLTGRQVAFLSQDRFKTSPTEKAFLHFEDLMACTLKGDNLFGFQVDWDSCVQGLPTVPKDDIMETLCSAQLKKSTQFSSCMHSYDLKMS